MRAVQAYLNIKERPICAYKNEFDILVWKLSVIMNKKLGFTTVLYTGTGDKPFLDFNGLTSLYDEIHYIDSPKIEQISLKNFWAAAKFVAIEEEVKRNEPFFMVDTDLVFMNDAIKEALVVNKNLFWANTEPAGNYPNLALISVPKGFKYPYYFIAKRRPFNTAIMKMENNEIYKDWLDIAWRFMIDNPAVNQDFNTRNFGHMVTVEQRFLPNVLIGKYHENPVFFCDKEIINFGREHFHIWGVKETIKAVKKIRHSWIKTLLLIIKQESKKEYNRIMKEHGPEIQAVLDNWDRIKLAPQLSHYLKNKEN